MKECKNCGKPMIKNTDFGNNDPKSVLCKFCFMDKGNMGEQISDNGTGNEKTLPSINDLDNMELL
jgi:hypothetical protein